MSENKKLLILGLGNVLMGDDGVGVHVINELKRYSLPAYCDIADGGTAGLGMVDLISGYGFVIVVDAVKYQQGVSPVSVYAPERFYKESWGRYSMHEIDPASVIQIMEKMDMKLPYLEVVGISAERVEPSAELSANCRGLITQAIELILSRVTLLATSGECYGEEV